MVSIRMYLCPRTSPSASSRLGAKQAVGETLLRATAHVVPIPRAKVARGKQEEGTIHVVLLSLDISNYPRRRRPCSMLFGWWAGGTYATLMST